VRQLRFSIPAHLLFAIAALAAGCLAGCSRQEAPATPRPAHVRPAAPAPAPAPIRPEPAIETAEVDKARAAALMRAIFGDDYRPDDDAALVHIEDGDDAGYWRMTLHAANTLPDGRTVVVANGAPSDENGADNAAHASAGMINAYTLRRKDGAWQVLDRHQDVGLTGSSGNIGSVKWIALGGGKPGIVVSSGGTWFGSTIAVAQVFDLDHGMRNLGGFAEMSSNAGACVPETKDCWDVHGKIGTLPAARAEDYREIVVDFEGRHFRVTEDADGNNAEHLVRTVRQAARYRFDGKTYVLVLGENPVPAIDG
jgi:hypothetical protein